MSSDSDEADGVDWEGAGRVLLQARAEAAERDVRDALRPLRNLEDPGLGVPRHTAAELRTAISKLQGLAEAVEEVDPAVGDLDELDTVTDDGTNTSDAEGEA